MRKILENSLGRTYWISNQSFLKGQQKQYFFKLRKWENEWGDDVWSTGAEFFQLYSSFKKVREVKPTNSKLKNKSTKSLSW